MQKQNYSKTCIIKSCEFNRISDKNSSIKMFRIPSDQRHDDWITAIRDYSCAPYSGLICINHFNADDLTGKKIQF